MYGLFLGAHTTPVSPPLGTPPPYNPGGVLAIIEFNVTYKSPNPIPENSTLGLYNTKLADTDTFPPEQGGIMAIVSNGTYYAPYTPLLGRRIDCFTDPYRKYAEKHYTYQTGWDYPGLPPNQNADAYEPQDIVILYALVTYNGDPVQNKYVAYEIIPMDKMTGVTREVPGFPIYRTAKTNEMGIATINFTIPWPCTNPEVVLGAYKCVQKVDIASTTISDTLWFEVGWIINLISVDVVNAKKCTFANVTITYENIAIGPFYDSAPPIIVQEACGPVFKGYNYIGQSSTVQSVYCTAVIYDDLGVPIGIAAEAVDVSTSGVWCTKKPGSHRFSIEIRFQSGPS